MVSVMAFSLYLMAAVCFYAGLYHFIFFLRRRTYGLNSLFSFFCFTHVLYFVAQGQWYSSETVERALICVQFAYGSISLILILQLWFFYYYCEKPFSQFINILSTALFSIFLIASFTTSDLTLSADKAYIKEFELFGTAKFTAYEFSPGILFELFMLLGFAETIFLFVIILRYYHNRYGTVLKPMPIVFSILLLAGGYDIFSALGLTNSIYMSEFAFMILLLTMAYRLTSNFIDAIDEVERLNLYLDTIVKARTRELEEKNNTLQMLSTTDPLTKLFNRRYLEDKLKKKVVHSERHGTPFSVILMDIDKFKSVNDNYGHDLGDQVLISISKTLLDNIRETDVAGRWGGEEFLILTPETDIVVCKTLAERLRIQIQNKSHASIDQITASFGIAQFKPDDSINSLIKRSDNRLYKAKDSGRNQVIAG